ncbi:MAG TPA: MbnP family protein, partial [Polyangiales bacterium]|nr:MbnP family protein [Polyangiales bacterium]
QAALDAELAALIEKLEAEKAELEQDVADLEVKLASSESSLADAEAALAKGDADAKAQATIAAANQKRLEEQLADAKKALDAANAQLADRSYEEALAELKAARALLESLESVRARTPSTLDLNVALRYGAEAFALEHAYSSASGALSFNTLRYWLTNIVLIASDDSRVVLPNAYYLMGAATAQTLENGTQRTITLPAQRRELIALNNVPPGSYKAIEFQVGVDAAHNDDLSLIAGELNVLRNMTGYQWMWFTSYIFTRTQGTFTPTAAPSTPAQLRWENGTNDDLRTVRLNLTVAPKVELGAQPRINLQLDVAKVIEGINPATTASIGASDAAPRTTLADNW